MRRPKLTVRFDRHFRWGTINNPEDVEEHVPMVMLTVHSPYNSTAFDCLAYIDTGAQELTLPATIAHSLGIRFAPADADTVITASGAAIRVDRAIVDVTIKGERVRVWASFGNVQSPLVGVTTIKKAMVFGLDREGWLHRASSSRPLPWLLRMFLGRR